LDYYHYHFWNHVLKKSIKMDNKEKVLLVAKDNKPCGLINYKEDKNSIFVNHVCSIPTGISEKVPWVGTVLFMSLFNDFLKKTLKQIRLSAAKDAPFPTIPKYERLGFRSIDEDAYHSTMVLKKESVESSLAKREKDVEYTEINNSKDIDLYDKLQFSKDMENLFKRYY